MQVKVRDCYCETMKMMDLFRSLAVHDTPYLSEVTLDEV